MGFIGIISESKLTALMFTFHLTFKKKISRCPIHTDLKSWASDVKLDRESITKSYQPWPCSSASFYWVAFTGACQHAWSVCPQLSCTNRIFFPAGWHPVSLSRKFFCSWVNHTILPCFSALVHMATTPFIPPLSQQVSTPFGETIIPGSPSSLISLFLCLSQIC